MVQPINPQDFQFANLPLPTSWDDSLSFLELTNIILNKINELISLVNTLQSTVTNQAVTITNLQNSITSLNNARIQDEIKILANQQHIGNPYNTEKGSLDSRVTTIEETLVTINQSIQDLTWAKSFLNSAVGIPYSNEKNISARLDDLETAVGIPYTAWLPLQTRVNTISTEVGTLNAAVGMPYTDASSISARLTALET